MYPSTVRGSPARRSHSMRATLACRRARRYCRASMRVVLADDTMLLREGVALLLAEAGFDVVAQAEDGEALVESVGEHHRRSRSSTCGCRPRTPTRACRPR